MDYPRINQFPEWFTVSGEKKYAFTNFSKKTKTRLSGMELRNGIPLNLGGGEQCYILVEETK
jgi:hypothetical protein